MNRTKSGKYEYFSPDEALLALENLKEEEWIRLKLKIRDRFFSILNKISAISPDKTPDDLIHTAIVATLLKDEKKKRSVPKDVPILKSLENIIWSNVSHLWEKYEKYKGKCEQEEKKQEEVADALGNLMDYSDNENIQNKKDAIIDYMIDKLEKNPNKILEMVSDDNELIEIVQFMMENQEYKPRNIAKGLSKDKFIISNAIKRLKRRLISLKSRQLNN